MYHPLAARLFVCCLVSINQLVDFWGRSLSWACGANIIDLYAGCDDGVVMALVFYYFAQCAPYLRYPLGPFFRESLLLVLASASPRRKELLSLLVKEI